MCAIHKLKTDAWVFAFVCEMFPCPKLLISRLTQGGKKATFEPPQSIASLSAKCQTMIFLLSRIGNESNWPRGRETLSPIQEISSGHLIVVPKTNSRALKFGVWIAIFPLMFCSFLFSCFAFLSRVNSNWQLPRRQVKWWIPFSCRSLLSDALLKASMHEIKQI